LIIRYFLIFLVAYATALFTLVDLRHRENDKSNSKLSPSLSGVKRPSFQSNVYGERYGDSGEKDGVDNYNIIDNEKPMTIGVASTVTGCTESPFQDGAAVLKYSLDRHSAAHGNGKYNYQSYILYHPNATQCVLPLRALGFTLLERSSPVQIEEIQGDELRERIVKNGCCGEVSYVIRKD
jgi:hypothetical protein